MSKCLESKSSDHLYETVDEWFSGCESEEVSRIFNELKEECEENHPNTETFFEDNEDEIKDEIRNRDSSNVVGDLIDNTRDISIIVEMHSNYDCINSHYYEGSYCYRESYFGAMVDALNLNPRKVAKAFKKADIKICGRKFPNRSERNGKEFVSYSQFVEEIENSSCPVNLLTFIATISLKELHKNDFNISEIKILKGNTCGLFSKCQGGGSLLEMELLKDVTLTLNKGEYDYFSLEIDGGEHYSIKETYGVYDSFFGKNAEIQKTA